MMTFIQIKWYCRIVDNFLHEHEEIPNILDLAVQLFHNYTIIYFMFMLNCLLNVLVFSPQFCI